MLSAVKNMVSPPAFFRYALDEFDFLEELPIQNFSFSMDFSFVGIALIAVAFWLIYAACKSDASPTVSTGGLTMLKVLTVISLVLICVAAGLAVLLFVLALILSASGSLAGGFLDQGMGDVYQELPAPSSMTMNSLEDIFGVLIPVLLIVALIAIGAVSYTHLTLPTKA